MTYGWRPAALWRDAYRDVRARPIRAILIVGMITVVLAGVGSREAREATSALALHARLRDAGSHLVVIRTAEPAGLDRGLCDGMGGVSRRVVQTGGVAKLGSVHPASAGAPLQAFLVDASVLSSPGRVSAQRPIRRGPSVALGAAAARELGLTAGDSVVIDGSALQVFQVSEFDLVAPSLSRGVLIGGYPRDLDECWVEFASPVEEADVAAVSSAAFGPGTAVSRALEVDGSRRDPTMEFRSRATRHAFGIATVIVASLLVLDVRARREEFALRRVLGTTPFDLLLGQTLGHAILALAAAVVATMIIGATAAVAGYRAWPGALLLPVAVAATVPLISGAAALLFSRGDVMSNLKGKTD